MGDLEGLKKVLRSLVVSTPTTMDAATLLRDYRRMLGEPLPSARHGYRDPVLFLRERCSDCFLFQGPQANPVLTLIVPDTIKHIDQYVQRQRMPTKNVRGKRRSVPESIIRNPHTNMITSSFKKVEEPSDSKIISSSRPAHSMPARTPGNSSPVCSTPANTNRQATHTEAPKHESIMQRLTPKFVKPESEEDLSEKKEKKQSLRNGHASEEESGVSSRQRLQRLLQVYQAQQLSLSRESLPDDDSGRQTSSSLSGRSASALATLQAEIARLVARRPGGVWCSELLRLYEAEYGRELPFARFRYPSVSACACDVAALSAARAPGGDWLLRVRGAEGGGGGAAGGGGGAAGALAPPPALRLRRARDVGSRASLAPLDPDDALPGIDYDPDVFPADCLSFLESIPAGRIGDIRPGDMLELAVGEVYSPSHLWVLRLGPEHERMEEIMDEMTEYYTKGEGKDRVLAAGARRPGQYCSSVFEGDWHRSLIVQVVDSDTVKVRHVDYGTVDTVPAAGLRALRREWAGLPAQAVRARLAGLRPAARSRRWPRAAAAACLALVRERRLVGNVVGGDPEENILELFLIDTSTEEDVNITDELIRLGHADPRPQPALGARESYLFPLFSALEAGATPNYAEIHALLRDGIALEFVEAYRAHVPALLPSDDEREPEPAPAPAPPPPPPPEPDRTSELGSSAGPSPPPSPSPSPPPPPPPLAVANRVPFMPVMRVASPSPPRSTSALAMRSTPESAFTPAGVATSSVASIPRATTAEVAGSAAPASNSTASSSPAIAPSSTVANSPVPSPAIAPSPAPVSPPVAPAPAAAPAPAPAPAPALAAAPPCCAARAPHPQSFYALPYCPCSKAGAACCSRTPAPPPVYAFPAPAAPAYVYGAYRSLPPGPPRPPRPPLQFYPPASVNYFGGALLPTPVSFAPGPPRCYGPPAPRPGGGGGGAGTGAGGGDAGAGAVRLSADECEVFELLSRVDPGAAHRYMTEALRRARAAAAAPAPAPLNPDAAEFRLSNARQPHPQPQSQPQQQPHPQPQSHSQPHPQSHPQPQQQSHPQPQSHSRPHPHPQSHPQPQPHPQSQPQPQLMRPPPGFEHMFK